MWRPLTRSRGGSTIELAFEQFNGFRGHPTNQPNENIVFICTRYISKPRHGPAEAGSLGSWAPISMVRTRSGGTAGAAAREPGACAAMVGVTATNAALSLLTLPVDPSSGELVHRPQEATPFGSIGGAAQLHSAVGGDDHDRPLNARRVRRVFGGFAGAHDATPPLKFPSLATPASSIMVACPLRSLPHHGSTLLASVCRHDRRHRRRR